MLPNGELTSRDVDHLVVIGEWLADISGGGSVVAENTIPDDRLVSSHSFSSAIAARYRLQRQCA
jgi:hypothetical protein